MTNTKNRISIQVGLSGYSFKIQADGSQRSSSWMGAERIFTTPEFQKRYDEVEISLFTPKFTLIPTHFHHPLHARKMLEDVVNVSETDIVEFVEVPECAAVLIYSNTIGETLSRVISESVLNLDGTKVQPLPEAYYLLKQLPQIQEYNKIIASYMDGYLYLVIAQGKSLLLCNSFQAPDFTTAEYFIFMAMKKLQLNPEVSTICFRTGLQEEQEMSLYRYFKNVELI
ncbi:MAG: DUF3822 family protein [Bacteroidales bacterium]|nr:DUF3822 family protein [Bacteroidales bacterium]